MTTETGAGGMIEVQNIRRPKRELNMGKEEPERLAIDGAGRFVSEAGSRKLGTGWMCREGVKVI